MAALLSLRPPSHRLITQRNTALSSVTVAKDMSTLRLLLSIALTAAALTLYASTVVSSHPSSLFSHHAVDLASLPGMEAVRDAHLRPEQHYSGHLPVDAHTNSSLFYYLVKARHTEHSHDTPLVIWLNGGPGCASTVALFEEQGPFLLRPSSSASRHSLPFKLVYNPYSWSNYAHMLYIDQPVGTGYAYRSPATAAPSTEGEIATQLYTALSHFFQQHHPELRSARLSLSGESYAAKYIPALSVYILAQNGCHRRKEAGQQEAAAAAVDPDSGLYRDYAGAFKVLNLSVRCHVSSSSSSRASMINLHSLLIGDGEYSPLIQRFAFRPLGLSMGFLDLQQANQYAGLESRCMAALRKATYKEFDTELLAHAQRSCGRLDEMISAMTGKVDTSDLRLYVEPVNTTLFVEFLNHPRVRAVLHIPSHVPTRKSDCSTPVDNALRADAMRSVRGLLPFLLKFLRITVYAGNFDLKDGAWANEVLLDSLWDWDDRHEWFMSRRHVWRALPGLFSREQEERAEQLQSGQSAPDISLGKRTDVYGYSKSFGNLSFVVVSQAGHMVPTSQPEKAADLFYRFTRGLPYYNAETEADRRQSREEASEVCRLLQCDLAGHGHCDQTTTSCRCDHYWAGVTCAVPVHDMTDSLLRWEHFSSKNRLQTFKHTTDVSPEGAVMYFLHLQADRIRELELDSILNVSTRSSISSHQPVTGIASSCNFSPPLVLSVKLEQSESAASGGDGDDTGSANLEHLSLSVLWSSAFHNRRAKDAVSHLADFDAANVFFGTSSSSDSQWIAPRLLAQLSDTSTRHELYVSIQQCDHFAIRVENNAGAVNDIDYRISVSVQLPTASERSLWEQDADLSDYSPVRMYQQHQALRTLPVADISTREWSTRLWPYLSWTANILLLCILSVVLCRRKNEASEEERTPLLRL